MKHTYFHDFGGGLTCTASFEGPPVKGRLVCQPVEWSRLPTRAELDAGIGARYVQWINSVREELSTRWNMTFLAAVNAENGRTEMWHFKPSQPAELVEVMPCNIPT